MRKCIRICSFLLVLASAAQATLVRFHTTGTFDSTGADNASYGDLTLLFQGVGDFSAPVEVWAEPVTFTSFGAIVASVPQASPGGTASDFFSVLVVQHDPSSDSGSLTGSLTGHVTYATSTGLITFSSTPLTLGRVRYSFALSSDPIVQPSTGGGIQTIEGIVEAVPEPSTFLLLAGALGTGLLFSKRYRRNA